MYCSIYRYLNFKFDYMCHKKFFIFIVSAIFFFPNLAFSWENGETNNIEFEKASTAHNIFAISLKEVPWINSIESAKVPAWVQGKIIGKPIKKEGFTWIKLLYEDWKTGWVQEILVIREYYYSMKEESKTVFLREKISLAGTEKVFCTTSSSINLSNILTSFRTEPRVFNYTPSERNSSYSGSTYSYNGILTSFRPAPRVFKYVVERWLSWSWSNIQNLATMITSSFRPASRVFNYTPSERSSSYSGSTYSYNGILTSFRPASRVFNYIPSERNSSYSGSTYSYNGVLTSFRPEPRVFNYTPTNYDCIPVQ